MTSINVQFVRKSSNAKTGAIPTTTSPRSTCPASCPLVGKGGCYAEAGYYTRMNWDKVDTGERGAPWQSLVDNVKKLPEGQVWRHNVAGDLPHDNQVIDAAALGALSAANVGKMGFTYTHHDMTIPANRDAVNMANRIGFTVNLSSNNLTHADELANLEIGPIVTLVPEDTSENTVTPQGRKVVICPATQRDDVSCASCKLCARQRDVIIAFPVHGTRKNAIEV